MKSSTPSYNSSIQSSRLTRDQMLMGLAHVAAARGTCNRLSVGAVLAFEARPISLGYNGAPSGMPHCGADCGPGKPCKNTIHAEDNAIRWARSFLGADPHGATLYVTDSPCLECAGKIWKAGVSRVVYDREYRITDGIEFLLKKGIEVSQCHVNLAISAN